MANIDLITGFLGAGKTTFIRKYVKYLDSIGKTYVVIENEYGSEGIDSMILQADGVTTDELFGGCICCILKVGFHDMLLSFADKVDRIIVEPSGVYDISQFYTVMSSEALKDKCEIGNVICIVDPTKLDAMDGLSLELLSRQVRSSGAVVFSMVDDGLSYISDLKSKLGYKVNLLKYDDLEHLYRCGYNLCEDNAELTHSASYLSTVVKPLPCDDVEQRITAVFNDKSLGKVLRVKGVWNGYLVNAIDGGIDISPFDGEDSLNIIGLNISRKRITEVLNYGLDRKEDKR
ncbi:MAG: hypothetical protein IKU19_03445 [Clostridia bacterium]|nr:hypothetical protein [Clostridia bacterium]